MSSIRTIASLHQPARYSGVNNAVSSRAWSRGQRAFPISVRTAAVICRSLPGTTLPGHERI
ncbi:hypothetical protein [Amycolatopsis lurida]|uniref:hypothetical protein n=1 Tax=Amycolatopsis lurida TaxID=31959 RepID=UPI0036592405